MNLLPVLAICYPGYALREFVRPEKYHPVRRFRKMFKCTPFIQRFHRFVFQQIVTWLKDGVSRQSSSSTPPTYTLNVDSVQKDDQGMYQCVVTNNLNNEMAHSFAELRLSGECRKTIKNINKNPLTFVRTNGNLSPIQVRPAPPNVHVKA